MARRTGPAATHRFVSGALLIRVDKDMAWRAPHDGRPGRPAVFSDAAMQFCLSVEILFELPLRQTSGRVARLMKVAGLDWAVPDFPTLWRRQSEMEPWPLWGRASPSNTGRPDPLSPRASAEPARALSGHPCGMPCRVTDSAGIKFLGDGEWQARKHGVQGRRQRRKVHRAMDPATSDIRAVGFTPSRDGDSPVLPNLPGPGGRANRHGDRPLSADCCAIACRAVDGAHDTRRCHTAIIERDASPIIPIRKNGRLWKEDCPAARARNDTLRAPRHDGRAFRKRWTGYHARSRIEARLRGLKSFGARIMARDPDRQGAEIHIPIALMNRSNARGTAEIVRVA